MKTLNMLDKELLDSEDVQRALYLGMKKAVARCIENKDFNKLGVAFMNIDSTILAIVYDGNSKYEPFSFVYKSHDISVEVLASLKEEVLKEAVYELEVHEEFSTWQAMISLDIGKHVTMNERELNLFMHDLKKYGEYQENFRILTEYDSYSSLTMTYRVFRTYLKTPRFKMH